MPNLAHVSITGISQTFDFILLSVTWLLTRYHIRKKNASVTPTTEHIYRYFGYFALFNFCMAAPNLALIFRPSSFSFFMAWGYVIGNIFLLISLSHISRMTIRLLPRFARSNSLVGRLWAGLIVIMTILNAIVIGLQNQPTYDQASRVTHYAIPAWMGAMLGMISFLAYLPAICVLAYSLLRQRRDQRIRTILLVLGFITIMFVGPLHAVASNWRVFLVADLLNVLSLIFLTAGVLYRVQLQTSSTPNRNRPRIIPSNTV